MSAAESQAPFTEEEVKDFADALRRIEGNYHREGSGPGSRFEGQRLDVVQVRYVLRALAEAGRLLPAGGEITVEWGVRQSKNRAGGVTTHRSEASARRSAFEWCDEPVRRSRWTGPWQPVQDGAP